MKKSMKAGGVLSPMQNQAMRLNRLEYRRLQRDINIMKNDLNENLNRLQRQAQDLRYRYTKFIHLSKPKPSYTLWNRTYDHRTPDNNQIDSIESIKIKPNSKSKQQQQHHQEQQQKTTSDELIGDSSLPLLVSVKPNVIEQIPPIIDLTETILRPRTSPSNKRLPFQNGVKPISTTHNNQYHLRLNRQQPTDNSSVSLVSSIISTSTRTLISDTSSIKPKISNNDSSRRKPLQNQTNIKSIERTRIEPTQTIDKESKSDHRVLRRTLRSADALK